MNRELTQDECRDQRTILKILERHKRAEWLGGKEFYDQFERNIEAMQITGTTDGEELAKLTDEDAKDRPWVMVREKEMESWIGPRMLLAAPPKTGKYVTADRTHGYLPTHWEQARLATENELNQAGITQ